MRLRHRIQLLFVAFALLVAIIAGFDLRLAAERDQARGTVETVLQPARQHLNDTLTVLVDQATAQRGYIITGDERLLASYEERMGALATLFTGLEELLTPRPDRLSGVERTRSRVQAWHQLGAGFEIDAKRDGRDDEAIALVATGTSEQLFDDARMEIADLRQLLSDDVDTEQARVDRLDRSLTAVRRTSLLAAAVLLALTVLALREWITQPLESLVAAVRSVAAGELDRPIPRPGPTELATLAGDVDDMRRRILAELEDASRAREALARRGLVVLALREQLAPRGHDVPPRLSLAVASHPAEGIVSGDWHDVVRLDDDRVAVVLVDVAGHGEAPAVFALRTKALLLAALRQGADPGAVFSWLARELGDTGELFLTGIIAEVDGRSGQVRYANAGHPPLLLVREGSIETLAPTGPLLGPFPGAWATIETELPPGGALVVYSDGLIEEEDDDGEELGVAGLIERLGDGSVRTAAELLERGLQSLEPSARHRDDTTIIVLSREQDRAASSSVSGLRRAHRG